MTSRQEEIQRRLWVIKKMRSKKAPWKEIVKRLHELGLGPLNGGEWTVDGLISFYVIMVEGKK
jgi:hypothetical protein